jgi:hypothetical protein
VVGLRIVDVGVTIFGEVGLFVANTFFVGGCSVGSSSGEGRLREAGWLRIFDKGEADCGALAWGLTAVNDTVSDFG